MYVYLSGLWDAQRSGSIALVMMFWAEIIICVGGPGKEDFLLSVYVCEDLNVP